MKSEYIIINKTALEKRIEELKILKDSTKDKAHWYYVEGKIDEIKNILPQSTPLLPEIEKAIQFGKDIRSEKSYIEDNFGSPFVNYEDSTEETNNYITNLKLDI